MSGLRERFAPVFALLGVFVALATLLRAALAARVASELGADAGLLARVFTQGLRFDLMAAAYAAAPVALALALVPLALWRARAVQLATQVLAIAALFALVFAALAEWLFWGEFTARFNFIAVDYLIYTHEVLADVWESYPVVSLLTATLIAALVLWRALLHDALERSFRAESGLAARAAVALAFALTPIAAFLAAPADAPRVAENRFANELAGNGLYSLFAAFRHNQLDYAPFYVTRPPGDSARVLHALLAEPRAAFAADDPLGLVRNVTAPGPELRQNVIVIVVESLSARFLGAFGNPESLTPNLDRLGRESLFFTNVYATGTRTVRGLEAVTLSVPPTPGYSIVKRPENANLFTIASVLRPHGYHARFFYGGWAYFDNMRAFFAGNGFEVIDQSALAPDESGFANAWGVADEFVFRRVLREARRSHDAGEHFLSVVLTTSNHRPFTYPDGRIDIPSGDGRAGAVKYTDWALGHFLEEARNEPFFADTVFAIVADHCASSAGELAIPVDQYHIPMLLFAPGRIAPQRVDTLASQIDLAPTLFARLGLDYESRFFGRDILDTPPDQGRALLGTYQRLGYYRGDLLTVLSPRQRIDVYRVRPDGTQQPIALHAARDRLDEAIAYYQSASTLYARASAPALLAQRRHE